MLGFRPICRYVNRCCRRRTTSNVSLSPFHTVESFSSTAAISPRKRPLLSRFLKFGSLATLAATGYVTFAYTIKELDEKTIIFRACNSRMDDPIILEYYEPYRSIAFAGEQNIKTKSNRDEDTYIMGYINSFIASAKAVCADTIYMYLTIRKAIEDTIQDNFKPPPDRLLPDMHPDLQELGAITLVLDLNDTLVHSNWKNEFTRNGHSVKRPGLDAFLKRIRDLGWCCELVLYTDELSLYVVHLVQVDSGSFRHKLTRGSTKYQHGIRYRDLSKLNRDPSKVLYVSGHALENCLQPENCVPIKPWKKERDDTTLMDILPFLEYVINERPDDVRPILASFKGKDVATECRRRMHELVERRMEERRMWEERKFSELRKRPWTLSECGKHI